MIEKSGSFLCSEASFQNKFADVILEPHDDMSLDSLWSESFPSVFDNSPCGWNSNPLIPTPPRSPSVERDELLGLMPGTLAAKGDMINPNSIFYEPSSQELQQQQQPSHMEPCPGLNTINLDIPFLDDLDIKIENLDTGFDADDLLFGDVPFTDDDFSSDLCAPLFDYEFKPVVVNDCMWAASMVTDLAAITPQEDKKPPRVVGTTLPTTFTTGTPKSTRLHLDSTSSRYSDLDPLGGTIANIESDLTYASPRLETPSESSDTDTDAEEEGAECPPSLAENVHLDHNYFSQHNHKGDITSPLMKALHKVSMAQTDSEDEIDVVSVGNPSSPQPQPLTLTSLTKFHGTFSVIDANGQTVCGGPAKRGRKPGSTFPRKVGRPPKATKRLHDVGCAKPFGEGRCGGRSGMMDPQKRSLHNSMERMRRVDLKNCFDAVRRAIPALRDRSRVPKVLILKAAADLVHDLEKEDQQYCKEVERLQQHHRFLRIKMQRLRGEMTEKEFG